MVFSSVKSRIRRKPAPSSPPQHSLSPRQQAPDLRRWSGFLDPFPPVALGGYTKYYLTHGLPFSPPPRPEPQQRTRLPPRHHKSSKSKALSIVPEAPTPATRPSTPSPIEETPAQSPISPSLSLRRSRKRTLLRTPSVQFAFPASPNSTSLLSRSPSDASQNSSAETEGGSAESYDSHVTFAMSTRTTSTSRTSLHSPSSDGHVGDFAGTAAATATATATAKHELYDRNQGDNKAKTGNKDGGGNKLVKKNKTGRPVSGSSVKGQTISMTVKNGNVVRFRDQFEEVEERPDSWASFKTAKSYLPAEEDQQAMLEWMLITRGRE